MSKQQNLQLYEQQNFKIARVLESEKLNIHEAIAQQKNMEMIRNLQEVRENQSKKCQYCDFQGVSQSVYYHTKNKHQKEFLEQQKDKDKYSKCEVCEKILRKQNFKRHQLFCNIKKISKQKSKDANFLKRIQQKQFQGCVIDLKEQNDYYMSLLGDLGIKDDQEDLCEQNQSESYENESNLSKQISDSEIFNTRKKLKKNEDEEGQSSKKICSQNSGVSDLAENIGKFQIMSQDDKK